MIEDLITYKFHDSDHQLGFDKSILCPGESTLIKDQVRRSSILFFKY